MGYILEAFVASRSDLEIICQRFLKAHLVSLNQGLAMIPMTEDLFDEINTERDVEPVESFVLLTKTIEDKILEIFKGSLLGYFEADYFGGQGGQIAIVWRNGERLMTTKGDRIAINLMLKQFWIHTIQGKDEFDSAGLGKFRNIEDWLESEFL